jgi:pyruvate/2-oxoglutarate dehydrogenase complex dihydrolipoamide acyltransferase (E2) component
MSAVREIILPDELGKEAESSVIMWFKEAGDTFKEGDVLVEVQTSKATFEVPATFAGTLKEIKLKRGESAPTGTVIATAWV